METAERISLPDDCTVGYIVTALLGASLTRSPFFHSHLENLGVVWDIHSQVQPPRGPRALGQHLLMHQLSSPSGDAQLRNGGEQQEHGQPERTLFSEGGSHEVTEAAAESHHESSVRTFPERTGHKYTSLLYIMVLSPVGEQINGKLAVFEVFPV